MTSYDPILSPANRERVQAFAVAGLTQSLAQVPGIAPDDEEALLAAGIETPHQLLGAFLSLQSKVSGKRCASSPRTSSTLHLFVCVATQGSTCMQLCTSMYVLLEQLGVAPHRSRTLIVNALAAKLNVWTPGWFDPETW